MAFRRVQSMRFIAKILITVAILGFAAPQIAAADDFPTRAIRVVVPYAAGGPSDTGARLMAEPLSRELGQPVIIEHQGGGGGLNATESYVKYPSDRSPLFRPRRRSATTRCTTSRRSVWCGLRH